MYVRGNCTCLGRCLPVPSCLRSLILLEAWQRVVSTSQARARARVKVAALVT